MSVVWHCRVDTVNVICSKRSHPHAITLKAAVSRFVKEDSCTVCQTVTSSWVHVRDHDDSVHRPTTKGTALAVAISAEKYRIDFAVSNTSLGTGNHGRCVLYSPKYVATPRSVQPECIHINMRTNNHNPLGFKNESSRSDESLVREEHLCPCHSMLIVTDPSLRATPKKVVAPCATASSFLNIRPTSFEPSATQAAPICRHSPSTSKVTVRGAPRPRLPTKSTPRPHQHLI